LKKSRREDETQLRLDAPKAWPAATRTTRSSNKFSNGTEHQLNDGLAETYQWIKEQYHHRKAGKRIGVG